MTVPTALSFKKCLLKKRNYFFSELSTHTNVSNKLNYLEFFILIIRLNELPYFVLERNSLR